MRLFERLGVQLGQRRTDWTVRLSRVSSAVFRGPNLGFAGNVTMLTSTLMRPCGVKVSRCDVSDSRGPQTPTMTFVFPLSTYAEPWALERTPCWRWGGRRCDGARPSGRR